MRKTDNTGPEWARFLSAARQGLANLRRKSGRLAGEYLTYNRSEQRGLLVLFLILLGLVIFNAVFSGSTTAPPVNYASFFRQAAEFEQARRMAADSDSLARIMRYLQFRGRKGDGGGGGYSKPASAGKEPPLVIELNAADTLDLQQLRGIGPGFARRITGYREKLGGYYRVSQLMEVFGMDTARYNTISEHLQVNPDSVRKMDINTVTFKELLRHPYFPFPVTKKIMIYRQKKKKIISLDELHSIEGISDSLFRRMVVYLRVVQ